MIRLQNDMGTERYLHRRLGLAAVVTTLLYGGRASAQEEQPAAIVEPAAAPPPSPTPTWHGEVEANPILYAFNGFSLNLAVKPPWALQTRFAVGRIALELPTFALGDNKDQGWHVNDRGYLVGARVYSRKERGGLFGGIYATYQRRDFVNDSQPGRSTVHQLVGAVEGGYEWFPFERTGFYATLNLVLAYRLAESGQPTLGAKTFKEEKFLPLPGIWAGWEL